MTRFEWVLGVSLSRTAGRVQNEVAGGTGYADKAGFTIKNRCPFREDEITLYKMV